MDEQIAKEILDIAYAFDAELGKLNDIISRIADEELREDFADGLGDILSAIADCLIFPLVDAFPELDRDFDTEDEDEDEDEGEGED